MKYYSMLFVLLVFACGIATACNPITEVFNETSTDQIIESDEVISADNAYDGDDLIEDEFFIPQTDTIDEHMFISHDGKYQVLVISTYLENYSSIEVTVFSSQSGAGLAIPISEDIIKVHNVNFLENAIEISGYISPSHKILETFSLEDGERISYIDAVNL